MYRIELRHSAMAEDDRPGIGRNDLETQEDALNEMDRIATIWIDHAKKSGGAVSYQGDLTMTYVERGWSLTIKAVEYE